VVQEILRQDNLKLRRCVRIGRASATSAASSAHLFMMTVVHFLFLHGRKYWDEPGSVSVRDSHASERSDQVAIDLHEP
jgi:hypothetical protein